MKILQLLRDNAGREKRPVNLVRNDGGEASLYIYDVIDSYWGVSALGVIDAIAQAGDAKTLNVYINSPAATCSKAAPSWPPSAASKARPSPTSTASAPAPRPASRSPAMKFVMSDGAFFMIHNASGMVWGDKSAMRETADLLERVEGSIVNDYTTKTGKDEAQVAPGWIKRLGSLPRKRKADGFVDSITTADSKAKNTWNLAAFKKAPRQPQGCAARSGARNPNRNPLRRVFSWAQPTRTGCGLHRLFSALAHDKPKGAGRLCFSF
jgi:ATP-dependent Clp protease protease subunit